jgi:hypothetical protein
MKSAARSRLAGAAAAAATAAVAAAATLAACGEVDARDTDSWRACGAARPPVLTDSGVGFFRVGASVADIHRDCNVLRDTTVALGREGLSERRLTAVLGSVATSATVADDRVWRIEIASPRFRTTDGFGVGSRLGDLRRAGGTLSYGEDGTYVVMERHCGLSFQLSRDGLDPGSRVSELPDSTRVDLVLVTGCG